MNLYGDLRKRRPSAAVITMASDGLHLIGCLDIPVNPVQDWLADPAWCLDTFGSTPDSV